MSRPTSEQCMSDEKLSVQANWNIDVAGDFNTGSICNNSNLKILSSLSVLNIRNNSNALFEVQRSNLSVSETANANVLGTDNDLNLQKNSNFNYTGDFGTVRFFGNTNTRVKGSFNNINAVNNTNLRILGNQNKLSITETINHEVTRVQGSENATNTVKINSNLSNKGWISSKVNLLFGKKEYCTPQLSIDYLEEAHIKKNDYKVGIFKFGMIPQNEQNQIEVRFNHSNFDAGSFRIKPEGLDTVVITACKDGISQHLKIIGPHINAENSENQNTLLVNLS